jgi:hypothetical protein
MPMTLSEHLLERLSKWKPTERQSLKVSDDVWNVAVTAERGDDLGYLIWDMNAHRGGTTEPIVVRDWAERLARRATGLLEHLKLIEVDDARRVAMLRSDEPSRRGEAVSYYEVLLVGDGSATVRRYRSTRTGGKREQVGFVLTHEAVAKLVGELLRDQ